MSFKLPEYCYHVCPSSGQLIKVQWGSTDYHIVTEGGLPVTGEQAKAEMTRRNTELSITEQQAFAMLGASMFNVWGGPEIRQAFCI